MSYTYVRAGQRLTSTVLNNMGMVGQTVFYATRDTAQSISTQASGNPAASDALSWETVTVDDLSGWASGSPTRYTCTVAGWYELTGSVSFAGSTAGNVRTCAWFVNGSITPAGHGQRAAETDTSLIQVVNARPLPVLLAVGDYVELAPGQETGAALNTSTGGARPHINIKFARPTG